jgi:putative chitobiose transport system substrate-binding protein
MRKNLSRRKFVFGLLLGLFASWSISCSSPSTNTSSAGGKEVEFWTMQLQPKFTQYFTEINTKFETENQGEKIRWIDVAWSAMESKIINAVQAKTAPDVVNLNPTFASKLATKNAWLNLEEKVPADIKNSYLSKIWQASTIDNKTFGLPWYLTTRVTIYNQNLFEKAGITKAPATFAELAEVAAKVKEKTGKYAFFATFVPTDSAEVLESLVQMGVKLVGDGGKAAFNSTEGKAAFQYWIDLYKKDLLPRDVLTQGHRRAIELYQAGETAILASGAEFLNTINNNAPTIAKASAAAPQITGNTGKKNVAVMNLVIPRDTDNADAAIKYALFVTNSENQLAFAKAANVLPSTQEAVDKYIQDIEKEGEKTAVEQARKISAAQLKDAEVLIPAMKDVSVLQKIIYDNLQAAMLGEKDVAEALQNAEEEWNSSLSG